MLKAGGRPVGFIGLENKKRGRLIIKAIDEEVPADYGSNEEILKGLVRSLGRKLKKDLAMLGYTPRFLHCPNASSRAGGELGILRNRLSLRHCLYESSREGRSPRRKRALSSGPTVPRML